MAGKPHMIWNSLVSKERISRAPEDRTTEDRGRRSEDRDPVRVGAGLVPARYGRESEERAPEDRSKVGVTEVRVNKKFDTDYADCTDRKKPRANLLACSPTETAYVFG